MYGKTQTKKLLKKLEEKRIDAALLVNLDLPRLDPNFYYFTGAYGFEHSLALIGKKSSLYAPMFELDRAGRDTWIKDIHGITPKGFLKELAKDLKGKKVGINEKFLPTMLYKKLLKEKIKVVDISKILKELRVTKTSEEIKFLKKAVSATKGILRKLDHSKRENQLLADIYYELGKRGMKLSFDPIVAYDADSTIPHFEYGNKTGGKSLLIDMGASHKGYCADITRTFLLDKKDSELKKIYKTVKEAQNLAIAAIKPGVKAKNVDKIARNYLKKEGYGLVHSLGHGIGLEIHEPPHIGEKSEDVLKEGMVFTIEPGIYLKGRYGVRIEDDVLVTKKGCEVL